MYLHTTHLGIYITFMCTKNFNSPLKFNKEKSKPESLVKSSCWTITVIVSKFNVRKRKNVENTLSPFNLKEDVSLSICILKKYKYVLEV